MVAIALLIFSPGAAAHFFAQAYVLPIPFWMYVSAAVAALVLSFAIVGVFAAAPVARPAPQSFTPVAASAALPGSGFARAVAVLLLALCIVSGLFGTRSPFDNFNMTFFWIGFVLVVPYLVAVFGDFYASLNPWRTIIVVTERVFNTRFEGRLPHSVRLAHWPALAMYFFFICVELFVQVSPRGLSVALMAYTFANLLGAWLIGRDRWLLHGEFFGVMMRLLGGMAPVARSGGRTHWRSPFVGLLTMRPTDMGLVAFILFMLSSTAFDGIHETLPWINFYWKTINPWVMSAVDLPPRQQNALAIHIYAGWQRMVLALSPFLYLACFALVTIGAGRSVRSEFPVRELVLRFSPCLLPIALVYHVTHYFTLVFAQGGQLVRLVSDPFGWGWNLLGTANYRPPPMMVDVGTIWHIQVALILIGHVASVYLAHMEALACWPSRKAAALSQLPMLLLMVLFTAFGLWILSLPLAAPQ